MTFLRRVSRICSGFFFVPQICLDSFSFSVRFGFFGIWQKYDFKYASHVLFCIYFILLCKIKRSLVLSLKKISGHCCKSHNNKIRVFAILFYIMLGVLKSYST